MSEDLTPVTVDLKQAAQITGLGVRTVRRRCDAGVFEWFTDGKRLISYESIMAWKTRNLQGNRPNPASVGDGAQ